MTSQKAPQNPKLLPRPPIVVVMGHVNHGKTSLLDYIRKTNVVIKEVGGITQAIGAYEVETKTKDGKTGKITFIDTPGHEAFSKMRSRGANAADLAILVVASDEGIKPQTKEAIKILKDTETPYVVALTKIDKNNANLEKVKNELLGEGVLLEGLGGDISSQGVSVKSGEGIDELLSLILLVGEIEDLSYDPKAPGKGVVIESRKDNRKGIVANCVLKDGLLKAGDPIATTSAKGKAKIIENFMGKSVKQASPSSPISIIGFENMPKVGEEFWVGESKMASKKDEAASSNMSGDDKKMKVILKAKNTGSLEVLRSILEAMTSVVNSSVGDLTANDIKEAVNTGSTIVNFGSKMDKSALNLADVHKIKIYSSDVIYELIKNIEMQIKGEAEAEPIGSLEILKVFEEKGRRRVIGGKVQSGTIKNNSDIQIERSGNVIGEGRIINLQSNKRDISQIETGECGMLIEAESKVSVGDIIKVF